jgi:hypothetical protein
MTSLPIPTLSPTPPVPPTCGSEGTVHQSVAPTTASGTTPDNAGQERTRGTKPRQAGARRRPKPAETRSRSHPSTHPAEAAEPGWESTGAYVAGEHHVLVRAKSGAVSSRLMGERGHNPGPTTSGAASLVELDDRDVPKLVAGDVLIARFGYGLGPVVVECVRTGIAGEGDQQFEVPVVEARIPTAQRLAFAPEELCRIRELRA